MLFEIVCNLEENIIYFQLGLYYYFLNPELFVFRESVCDKGHHHRKTADIEVHIFQE